MGIQYIAPAHWLVRAGLFSTADLLVEDYLRLAAPAPEQQLTVNLNTAVWSATGCGEEMVTVACVAAPLCRRFVVPPCVGRGRLPGCSGVGAVGGESGRKRPLPSATSSSSPQKTQS